jgi:hypothetical protein
MGWLKAIPWKSIPWGKILTLGAEAWLKRRAARQAEPPAPPADPPAAPAA